MEDVKSNWTVMQRNGWDFDFISTHRTKYRYNTIYDTCNNNTWFGYNNETNRFGRIKAKFTGTGIATLNFSDCGWGDLKVYAKLDGNLLLEVNKPRNNVTVFNFRPGSMLEIYHESYSTLANFPIIQIHSLNIDCNGKKVYFG